MGWPVGAGVGGQRSLAGNWAPCLPPVGAKAPAQFPRRACGAWPGWRRHALGSIPELSSRLGASPQTPSPRRVRRVGAPLASVPKLPQPCWPARGGRAGARARASEASGAGDRQVERGRHTTVVDASGACGPLSPRYRRGDCVSWKWVPSRVRAPKGSPTLAHPLPSESARSLAALPSVCWRPLTTSGYKPCTLRARRPALPTTTTMPHVRPFHSGDPGPLPQVAYTPGSAARLRVFVGAHEPPRYRKEH